MPSTLHVTFQLVGDGPADPARGLHAALHERIAAVDGALAQRLHDTPHSPLSLGLARYRGFGGVLGRDRSTVQARLRTLDDALLPALEAALAPGELFGLEQPGAQVQGRVAGLLTETVPYEQVRPANRVTLHFLSPTALKSRDAFLDEPHAPTLLRGLLRHWNAFAPEPMPEAAWQEAALVNARAEVTRGTVRLPKAPRSTAMFMGRVQLELPGAARGTLGRAAQLAEWSGAGVKTLYGFGEVAVELG